MKLASPVPTQCLSFHCCKLRLEKFIFPGEHTHKVQCSNKIPLFPDGKDLRLVRYHQYLCLHITFHCSEPLFLLWRQLWTAAKNTCIYNSRDDKQSTYEIHASEWNAKSNYIHQEQAEKSATDKLSKCPDITGEISWLILASIYILELTHIIKLWASEVLLYFHNHK